MITGPTTREYHVNLSVDLKFDTAHEALVRSDELVAMFERALRVSVSMRTTDRITREQLEGHAADMEQAQRLVAASRPSLADAPTPVLDVVVPATSTKKPRKTVTTPAPTPDAIDGEPTAVAGDAPLVDTPTGGTATPQDAGGSEDSGQEPGGASTDSAGGSTATAPVPSDDEMRAAVSAAMKRAPTNRAKVSELLKQCGVEAVSHVPDGARPTFLEAVAAL